jgi:citrate lyase subunit beta/citryl-CoA lyase
MTNEIVLRRSLLGIPGNEHQLVADAIGSDPDHVFFDLEDSLAPSEKPPARDQLVETVTDHDWGEVNLSYRINGTATKWWYEDVLEVVTEIGDEIESIIVPKVRDPGDVRTVDTLVASVEMNAGLEPGSIGISAQIETARAMNSVAEIAHATDRLDAVIFGPADYAASIGAARGAVDYPGHYWHYPLSRISHAAASAGVHAIGGPYTPSDDSQGFYRACRFERALGYDGKVVIHPEQVETANETFSPGADEISRARRIVDEYDDSASNAVAAIDGKVIDREMYLMAKRIILKAEKAGLS